MERAATMIWSAIGAVALAVAVALGAFGAHGLRGRLDAYSMGIYEKAVFYHFIHAIGILVVPLFARFSSMPRAGLVCALLAAGILFFSGSLYLLAVTGERWLGAVTPIGGVCFISAWTVLAVSLWRATQ